MTDNQLIQVIISILEKGLIQYNQVDTLVRQAFQPTKQGVYTQNTLFFYKVGDIRYGFLKRSDIYDEATDLFIHTETQKYESTFQINALAIQNPANINNPTASDLVNLASGIMQSDYARGVLKASNIGIIRVTDIRNPYFADDKDRFEASPSFDFTLTYDRVLTSATPAVNTTDYQIISV